MNHKVEKHDVIWGYFSQGFTISSNLVLLPFIFIYLSTEDIGIWYVFITIVGLVQLLEFGFLPTMSRYISYVFSGAKDITADSIPQYKNNDFVDITLLSNIIKASKKIYLIISLIAFFFVSIVGIAYLSLLDYSGDRVYMYISWLIYGSSSVIIFYFGYYNSILKGRGDQTQLNKIVVISKITNVLIVIPLLYLGVGIMSISIGMFFSVVVDRILIRRAVFHKTSIETIQSFSSQKTKDYTTIIWNNAKLMGMVQLGNFLTLKSSLLIISYMIGLEAAAVYGLTLQITSIAIIIASMYLGLQIPFINAEQVKGKKDSIREIFTFSLGLSWLLFFLYILFILIFGNFIVEILFNNVNLLPTPLLIVFLIISFLEMNHSLCTLYLTTTNEIVFMWPILISGFLIVLFSIIGSYFYGMWGIILTQLFIQLAYNNWKWPLVTFRSLNLSFYSPIESILNFKKRG